jgi:hypothetical protein
MTAAWTPSALPPAVAGLLLRRDAARDVALRDVRELVRQHRGQGVGRGGQRDQAQVHAHVAAGQREGVHGTVVDEKDLPREGGVDVGLDVAAGTRGAQQRRVQLLHVVEQDGVVEVGGVAPAFAQDGVADAALLVDGEVGRGGLAQRRQAHGVGRRRALGPGRRQRRDRHQRRQRRRAQARSRWHGPRGGGVGWVQRCPSPGLPAAPLAIMTPPHC